jgi:4-hydroxy-tetrahydrodipicolinate synthase
LSNDTALRLAEVPGIVGIKDATGNLERGSDLIRRAPPGFSIYSGDDASGLAFMLLGGHGVISVTANVAPRLMRALCDAALSGNLDAGRQINDKLLPLHSKLFVEANPIPVKWACAELGLIPRGLRLPLTPLSDSYHAVLRDAMRHAGLL